MTNSYSRRSGKHSSRIRKQGGNVVTYFCTPGGRVLHFVVGPVSSQKLLASAQWAHETYQQLIEQEEMGQTLDQRRRWIAVEHEEQLAQDSEVLGKVTDWLSGTSGTKKAVVSGEVKQTFEKVLESLKGATGDDGHQLLSVQPLSLLSDIEKPVFEVLAGQSFSRRANQLRKRVLKNIRDGRPTLLTVANLSRVDWSPAWDELETDQPSEPNLEHYLPSAARVKKHLHAFHWEVLSSGELTMVVAALDHPPIKLAHGTRPKYVILDQQGAIASVISDVYPVGVLARMMEKHVVAQQGPPRLPSEKKSLQVSSEQLAQRELRLAESLIAKRPTKARERLKKIVSKYPGTESAADALGLLAPSDN